MTEYWQQQMNHDLTRGYYEALVKIIEKLKPQKVLEIGTGWGISGSAFMDHGVKLYRSIDANIDAVHCQRGISEIHQHRGSASEVYFMQGDSKEILKKLAGELERYDFIFIDGDHQYEGALADLRLSNALLEDGGHIVLDDFLHGGNFGYKGKQCGVMRAARDFLLEFRKEALIVPHNAENGFLII